MKADVVVVGGGPAGAATALALARAGLDVVVLERSAETGARIGETLPPGVKPLLGELGVWERFQHAGHLASPGIVSVWGSDTPYENDFIVSPYGSGWHVDRRRFDAMLATAAQEAGARLIQPVRLRSCQEEPSGAWRLEVWQRDRRLQMESRFLVEATGRARAPIGDAGERRWVLDRLVGVVGFFQPSPAAHGMDRRTLVEAASDGWWYSAALPDGRLAAAYMSDADLIPRRALADVWRAALSRVPLTRERLASCQEALDLQVVAANSYRREFLVQGSRLAVGDTAVAFDPLSSQGLCKALASGLLAADSIARCLRGEADALPSYARQVEQESDRYLQTWAHYYGRERRWPNSPFWQRRQR